jgi:hypothetical protein
MEVVRKKEAAMEIVCNEGWCEVTRANQSLGFSLSPMLEGPRKWLQSGSLKFQETPKNCKAAESLGFAIKKTQKIPTENDAGVFDIGLPARPVFSPPAGHISAQGEFVKHIAFAHQLEAHDKFADLQSPSGVYAAAMFQEMGTGKTKSAIDLVTRHWCLGRIDAVLVLAKKGVHLQWVTDEAEDDGTFSPCPVKKFTQRDVPLRMHAWDGKKLPSWLFRPGPELAWFTINFDAVIHPKARKAAEEFIAAHKGRVALIGDETHYLKNPTSLRTKAAMQIGAKLPVKIIMTGTPIAKNLVDEWSQLRVLDEAIIGCRYLTTFRNEFCVMGGFEGKQVVGAKDLERFKSLTEPYVFRVRKADCLDLPEKNYRQVKFDLCPDQIVAIQSLKQNQWFDTAAGERIHFEGVASALGKIQEVSNGFLMHPDGLELFENPRLEALKSAVETIGQKVVIWARYKQDVKNILAAFGERAIAYYGETDAAGRKEALAKFTDPLSSVDIFVATQGAAAEGIDGLQQVCSVAIYYSNTFNSIQRWQSEDRIHRIGMGDKALYIDLIARGCIDSRLVNNLRSKKAYSDLVLDLASSMEIQS